MDTLNNDATNISKVFKEHKPSQFRVSSELLASKELRGYNGLMMRAITTPDQYFPPHYDPFQRPSGGFVPCKQIQPFIEEQLKIGNFEQCVQLTVLLQKQMGIEQWTFRTENDVVSDARMIYWHLRKLRLHIIQTLSLNLDVTELHYGIFTRIGLRCIKNFIFDIQDLLEEYFGAISSNWEEYFDNDSDKTHDTTDDDTTDDDTDNDTDNDSDNDSDK